jgi:hypothetical protein
VPGLPAVAFRHRTWGLCVSKRCGSEVALAWSLRNRVDEAAVSDPGVDAERSLNELVNIDKVVVG